MENASKALIIAGGALIAIMIISLLLAMYGRIASIKKEQQEQIEMEQLAAFNIEYEAFNKKVMYGTDVITLINKIEHNNEKFKYSIDYKITVTVDGRTLTSSELLEIDDIETTIFKCTNMEYNSIGRVCKIEIEKR